MSEKVKYKVVAGKHAVQDEDGNVNYVREGETIMLTEEEVAQFPNKFERVMVPDEGTVKEPKETKEASTSVTAPKAVSK